MFSRLVAVFLIVAALAGLLVYSQYRSSVDYVSGFIEADEIRVGSRVGGRVAAVHIEEGQRVTAGQTLFELEPYDLLEREREAIEQLATRQAEFERLANGFRPQEIAQAKARFERQQAVLDKLRAGPRQEEIDAARARVQVSQAELSLAKRKFERREELLSSNSITREEFEEASEQIHVAQGLANVRQEELDLLLAGTREEEIREAVAQVEEARQAWMLAQEGSRKEEVQAAKAARDAAAAALEVVRAQKEELTVQSPVDGVVEALDLQKGDLAPAGGPVLSIMDMSHLWVRAYVPQNRVGLQVGEQLPITVDSLPGQRMVGRITFISRQAEFTPNNVQTPEERSKQVFRIKVDLPKDKLDLVRPGMTADVWLQPVTGQPAGDDG
ncbi:HlyD family efflux transporter periplasmic adaptor subunit [Aeoliella sp. ICT_H6.2]|uniref:HlyD family efflux transporter periplasmic adaptor subunit n=1 Tax=Aeoliella straminimaris TaxID=2954799 RepID=A0A9X2F904_9BACT|nr:efflux RND transporter periplasmic adaptor subunit [Aeoliella straminimaris]MCO6043878.1 HlyD family efflux transporter periplasmic adaptor subunit [Aeoliella straminimaris]